MFEKIVYYVGNKSIEINGEVFSLGEFTTAILNFPRDDYDELRKLLDSALNNVYKYESTGDLKDWFEANEYYIKIDEKICNHKFLKLLREDNNILEEAKQFTSQLSLFENDDCRLTEKDLSILSQIQEYEDYLKSPEDYPGDFTPDNPPLKTRALLIFPGDASIKWEYYKQFVGMYSVLLNDILSFNNTIYAFINLYLSSLKKLNAENYACALFDFFSDPTADKLIASPMNDMGMFTNTDFINVRYIPRETFPGSDEYKIYEYHEADCLQAFLKTDFYKALETGYIIRKCEYCGRYFLLKKAYHTKYCDRPAPDNPKYTCAQLGYHFRGIKEVAVDNPKVQSLHRCYLRIDKDYSRGIITAEEKEILYAKAKDLHHEAKINPEISNDDFEKSLASKNLYPLCGVVRRTKPRGRPRTKQR